jgi:hypothetical protein
MTTIRLPDALANPSDDAAALRLLARYFGPGFGAPGSYTGAAFDTWDSAGTRASDTNRFTADDLVAVTFLSVDVDARTAYALLHERADEFAALLAALGPDRDLAEEEQPLEDDWVGWQLQAALRALPGTGTTTATKLLARKRPRLRPIWDSVVASVTGTQRTQWEPLRAALRENDQELHRWLQRLHQVAGLPPKSARFACLTSSHGWRGRTADSRRAGDDAQPDGRAPRSSAALRRAARTSSA